MVRFLVRPLPLRLRVLAQAVALLRLVPNLLILHSLRWQVIVIPLVVNGECRIRFRPGDELLQERIVFIVCRRPIQLLQLVLQLLRSLFRDITVRVAGERLRCIFCNCFGWMDVGRKEQEERVREGGGKNPGINLASFISVCL